MTSILITGGSGSFGRAFVHRLLNEEAYDRIVVFSRGEHAQETMEREMRPLDPTGRLRFFIGDVRDQKRLALAMRGVDTVVHAAALKVVPKCEADPIEAIHTNVIGAQNVIEAAISAGVWKVVAISTDKAVSPVNLYGSTKLCAEKLFTAAKVYAGQDGPRFAVVRYGNVSGSQGSVIPLWQDMIAKGAKALPVTNPLATRFWLTLDEATELVSWTLANMRGGEIVVPDMPAYMVDDLADAMCPGLHDVSGLRPGEKMHEAIVNEHEARNFVRVGNYWVANGATSFDQAPTLAGALTSDKARRMSVEELRERLAALSAQRLEAA